CQRGSDSVGVSTRPFEVGSAHKMANGQRHLRAGAMVPRANLRTPRGSNTGWFPPDLFCEQNQQENAERPGLHIRMDRDKQAPVPYRASALAEGRLLAWWRLVQGQQNGCA